MHGFNFLGNPYRGICFISGKQNLILFSRLASFVRSISSRLLSKVNRASLAIGIAVLVILFALNNFSKRHAGPEFFGPAGHSSIGMLICTKYYKLSGKYCCKEEKSRSDGLIPKLFW